MTIRVLVSFVFITTFLLIIAMRSDADIDSATCARVPKGFWDSEVGRMYTAGFLAARLSEEAEGERRTLSIDKIIRRTKLTCIENPDVPVWAVLNGEYSLDKVQREMRSK